jgi:hypothetical protein
MEPLFRLTLRRPPVAQDPESPSISLVQDSDFQSALSQGLGTLQPRPAVQRLARSFVAEAEFIGSPEANPLHRQLTAFARALDDLDQSPTVSSAEVAQAVRNAFEDQDPEALVQSSAYSSSMRRLRDSLLVIKLLPEEHGRPFEALVNQLRIMELIARLAVDPDFPASPAALHRYRQRSLALPSGLRLKPVLSTAELDAEQRMQRDALEAERRKLAEQLFATHQSLRQAVNELTGLGGEHFQSTPAEADQGVVPPAELRADVGATRKTAYFQRLTEVSLKQLEGPASAEGRSASTQTDTGAWEAPSAAELATQLLTTAAPRPQTGSPAFRQLSVEDVGFRLNPEATNALSEGTRTLLAERQVPLTTRPLDQIVEALQAELQTTGTQLNSLYGNATQQSIKRFGDTLVTIVTPLPSAWTSVSRGGPAAVPALPAPPPAIASVPQTRGTVSPAGVADLLIVRQQLIGYEGADIAHIENVLRGESKVRDHTRREEVQQLTFLESERTATEERELESTNRFELTRETNVTIQEDAALQAGLALSGKYGPSVDFSASAEGSTSRSKEEATKTAANFSQDVTQRSATKITERALQRTSRQITNEVIEKNTHTLNNVAGSGHISGVYQWVNKLYQAQMFNYGLRTLFDFMVPEPAAFYIASLQAAQASAATLQKPPDFTLRPDDLTEENYGNWVRLLGATDVVPPPEPFRTKSLDFKAGGGNEDTHYNHSGQITIDAGYRAVSGTVGRVKNSWGNDAMVDVVLGQRAFRFRHNTSWVWTTPLDGETDTIPFALDTFKVSMIAVAAEVKCQRTETAMHKWQLDTHAKLTSAYQARLADYEEKLAAAQVQAGVPIRGRHPATNLDLMKDELKKNCISILTDQHFDLFNAIENSWLNGLPQLNVAEAEAEGAYVRFFEHAFEWEEMTWVTYPYFWGRKTQWQERLGYEDPDPLFNQFLKAGYCRVVVPARPGFEGAIDHYLKLGELWNGGPLPTVSSELYLSIADEIAERLDRPGDEIPQGEAWLVRIPTTLVRLRSDDALPRWIQDADGNWVEA